MGALAYKISGSNIVNDILDGEAVVLNLATGLYYSMPGSAALVWQSIQQQHSVDDMLVGMLRLYDGDRSLMESSLEAFLQDLKAAGIIVEAEPRPAATLPGATQKMPFEPPRAGRYDDLEEVLLMDPVHDSSTGGWPNVNPRP